MIKYIDKGTARQHLTDRLMESALNNVGVKADADEVFRDIAENRLPVWMDELQTYDVQEVRHGYFYEDDRTYAGGGRSNYKCSVCGRMAFTAMSGLTMDRMWNFCPYCGAKMDVEQDG